MWMVVEINGRKKSNKFELRPVLSCTSSYSRVVLEVCIIDYSSMYTTTNIIINILYYELVLCILLL